MKAVLHGPALQEGHGLRRDGFRIDGNEGFRAAERHDTGAVMREHLDEEVACDGGMLIDADAQAGKAPFGQQRAVARAIKRHRAGMKIFGRFLCSIEDDTLGTDRLGGGGDRGLVRLVDLAVRPVELDAVAVGGNVRTRHHQAGGLAGKPEQRQGRRRQCAAIARLKAGLAQRGDGDG